MSEISERVAQVMDDNRDYIVEQIKNGLIGYMDQQSASDRRERIATAALAAFVTGHSPIQAESAAKTAVLYADALIAELDR